MTELERLLPFHVTGTLNKRDADCVERGFGTVAGLAQRVRQIQKERSEIVRLGTALGCPSDRPLTRLLAAITRTSASKRRMPEGKAGVPTVFKEGWIGGT